MAKKSMVVQLAAESQPAAESQLKLYEEQVMEQLRDGLLDLTQLHPCLQKRLDRVWLFLRKSADWGRRAGERAAKRKEWEENKAKKKSARIVKLEASIAAFKAKLDLLKE